MSISPQQDWNAFAAQTTAEDSAWIRGLSTEERFALYADMFGIIWKARQNGLRGDWDELDEWSWQRKLADRQRCVEAYRKLDEFQHVRAAEGNSG
jgi:hypothetical protein